MYMICMYYLIAPIFFSIVLKKFLQNARAQEMQAERRKIDRLANFRAHDRQLLEKHRQERIKVYMHSPGLFTHTC